MQIRENRRDVAMSPVSMVVEGEDVESSFTKDERSVRYERIQEIT